MSLFWARHQAIALAAGVFLETKIPCNDYATATANLESNLAQLQVESVDLTLIHFPCRAGASPPPQIHRTRTTAPPPVQQSTVWHSEAIPCSNCVLASAPPSCKSGMTAAHPMAARARRAGQDGAGTWRAMEDFYKAGKSKTIGVSNYGVADLEALKRNSTVQPAVNQCKLSVVYQDEPTIQVLLEEGLRMIVHRTCLCTHPSTLSALGVGVAVLQGGRDYVPGLLPTLRRLQRLVLQQPRRRQRPDAAGGPGHRRRPLPLGRAGWWPLHCPVPPARAPMPAAACTGVCGGADQPFCAHHRSGCVGWCSRAFRSSPLSGSWTTW